MKFYVDYLTKKVDIERETPFYQSEDLVSKIEINVANITDDYFVSLEFVLPNGHKLSLTTTDPFETGEATTVTRNDVTYSINKFTLSSLVLSCAGQLQFTAYANFTEEYTSGTSTLVRTIKRAVLANGVNTVLKTATLSEGYILALDTDNAGEVASNLFDEITRLTALLAGKANKGGSEAQAFQSSEITEGGLTLVNKYHPKGGSSTLDLLVKILTATTVNASEFKQNGVDLSAKYHPYGGNTLLDIKGNIVSGKTGTFNTLLVGSKNVATKEFVNESVARDALVSTIGNAGTSIEGLMSAEDKVRLDGLVALLGSESGDADTVVNTIREVLAIFSQYPEGATLVNALSLKANASDVNTALSGKVDKVVGKGLSTNDFTDTYKETVDNIGDLESLETTAKSTVVYAINEVSMAVSNIATTSEIVGLRG